MVKFGFFIIVIELFIIIFGYDKWSKTFFAYISLIFFIAVGCIYYDVTSPVKTREELIITNDLQKYKINVISEDTLFYIRRTITIGTRPLAVSKDSETYTLILKDAR